MSETSAARKIFKSGSLVAVMVWLVALTFIALASGAFDSSYLVYCIVTLLLAWGIYRSKSIARAAVMLLLAALAFIAVACGIFDSTYDGAPKSDGPAGASLAGSITELRKEKKLVGLAAMVMVDGQVMASAAHGERKKGSGVPIELGDRWHLGSITKSITATMIARLVESGQMKWTDTIGERFPDASIHEDWKSVTLQQLLTHTSGAPANFSLQVKRKKPALGPECTQERRKAVMDVIAEKPAHPPGEKYAYSNVGYTIAGAMAETATGVSWEDLVKREVFKPLELSDAGFGPPKSPSATLDQPRGHLRVLGWKVSADDDMDNTPIMGPAGAVHMTLSNLCKYATEHLRGELGAGKLLTAETYKRLHTPKLQDYACGWVVKQPTSEIPHTVYWHNGSNTMWYALVVFIPEKNMVVAVTSNDGDIEKAEAAAWEIVKASAKQFNVEGDAARRKSLAPGGQERNKETFRDVAGRMVKAINAADYEAIRKDFNKKMLEAFPVERCRTFFSQEISGKFGKINKLDEPPQFKSAAEAVFVARCERGALDFTLVLDDQGRVAGMLFRPR
jgi:CubicO group peptidase (beta-lactamase class C family)